MSTTTTVILVVIAVVIVIAVVAALLAARRKTRRREQAAEVRAHAVEHTGSIHSSREDLAVAESRAEVARAEAERAEQQAAEARRGLEMDQARQEDVIREADRIDPDVNHRADDYEPGTGRHRTT